MKVNSNSQSFPIPLETPEAIQFCEDWTLREPDNPESWAYLGLSFLLNEDEESAQFTWLTGLSQQPEERFQDCTDQIIRILDQAATKYAFENNLPTSWLIRRHILEIQPAWLKNLLQLLHDTISLQEFTPELLDEWQVVKTLQESTLEKDSQLLKTIIVSILTIPDARNLEFAEASKKHFSNLELWIQILIEAALEIGFQPTLSYAGISILELALKYSPTHYQTLSSLIRIYIYNGNYQAAIITAQQLLDQSKTIEAKFCSNCLLLQSLMKAGSLYKVKEVSDRHKSYMRQLFESGSTSLDIETIQFLIINAGALAYLEDNLKENRWFQNQAGQLFLRNFLVNASSSIQAVEIKQATYQRKIRIGYISSTLRNHSVGWLCRWIFKYHDRVAFEIYIYLVDQKENHPFFQEWFASNVDKYTYLSNDIGQSANNIRKDNLDILIDLDSFTVGFTASVLALKPAPIQVTWLGCDALGLSTIDYFIADPYVLPDDAQNNYCEQILRLPNSYIAIDGFEVGNSTLNRLGLNLPSDAVIYLSTQTGSKRNLNMLRLQLQIIKAVPNSYFLIKGLADQFTLQEIITLLAKEEGIQSEQLRFLPIVESEYEHRANLFITDIVLDTYPYNGATTTLETLWMGIPVVTRVGQTFSSRNSYTFLKNVGVTEGIAWTDEEYIEWGIRFGQDEQLRQQVSWKLKQSRRSSPLWNAKQFTRDMETAYQQMWANYLAQQ
jgi:predicted O-linked N-acetylglucosamine transferase (SPINDLY family)